MPKGRRLGKRVGPGSGPGDGGGWGNCREQRVTAGGQTGGARGGVRHHSDATTFCRHPGLDPGSMGLAAYAGALGASGPRIRSGVTGCGWGNCRVQRVAAGGQTGGARGGVWHHSAATTLCRHPGLDPGSMGRSARESGCRVACGQCCTCECSGKEWAPDQVRGDGGEWRGVSGRVQNPYLVLSSRGPGVR